MASRVTREPLLEQAAASLDAVMAAALAVSLCVGAGSAALAPLALLGGFVPDSVPRVIMAVIGSYL